MMLRCLIAALALATFATDSEAGPFRRRARPVYQPVYYPTYSTPSTTPSSDYVSYYSPVNSTAGESSTPAVVVGDSGTPSTPTSLSEGDGLAEVNAKRAAMGLPPYLRDENLSRAAAGLCPLPGFLWPFRPHH